ncbi:MAG: DMT family transporter [Phycisphaerales bacterium]|nr:DMT family transporter [Phycisphaerales bacterium]
MAAPARTERPASPAAGLCTVVMTLLGWSSVPLFLKHFSHSIDPWTSNGWRYGFSALLWAPVLLFIGVRGTKPSRLWRAAVVPALFNACGQVLFTLAHYRIEPALLTFGLRLQIVFVALGAAMLFPAERRVVRSPIYLAGAALVLLGAVGTALLGKEPLVGGSLEGFLMAAGSGALFAGYALSVRKTMAGIHPVVAFAAISQYTAGAMVVLMLALGERSGLTALDLSTGQFALLLLSAVIGIALGHVFYYISIANLGVAISAGVIQLQPFVVGAASFVLFDERLTPLQWCSGLVAVSGAVMMLWLQKRLSSRARAQALADEAERARAERLVEPKLAEVK